MPAHDCGTKQHTSSQHAARRYLCGCTSATQPRQPTAFHPQTVVPYSLLALSKQFMHVCCCCTYLTLQLGLQLWLSTAAVTGYSPKPHLSPGPELRKGLMAMPFATSCCRHFSTAAGLFVPAVPCCALLGAVLSAAASACTQDTMLASVSCSMCCSVCVCCCWLPVWLLLSSPALLLSRA